jgi:hypothetical protein
VLSHFVDLDENLQDQVLDLLRASAVAPEDMARSALARRRASLGSNYLVDRFDEIATLLVPGATITSHPYKGQHFSPESDDGYRPARQYGAWFVRHELCAGGKRFVVGDVEEYLPQPQLDVEKERRRLIAERWAQIEDGLRLDAPDYPEHGFRILGMDKVQWVQRYVDAWTTADAEYRRVLASRAIETLREVLRDAEWAAFLREAPRVEVAEDATALPPPEIRPLRHQVAYGIVSIATAWAGPRYHTSWYRDAMHADTERARAVEEAAPLLARRATTSEEREHDRRAVVDPGADDDDDDDDRATPVATAVDPPTRAPTSPTSLADLKARFNRRGAS